MIVWRNEKDDTYYIRNEIKMIGIVTKDVASLYLDIDVMNFRTKYPNLQLSKRDFFMNCVTPDERTKLRKFLDFFRYSRLANSMGVQCQILNPNEYPLLKKYAWHSTHI